jgi:hypothetical protein
MNYIPAGTPLNKGLAGFFPPGYPAVASLTLE